MSLPAALADAPSSVAESSSSSSSAPRHPISKYTPEQAAAAKAARRASMLDYARRVRRDEHDYAYADGRAAAVRFLSPLPHASSRAHSSSSLSLMSSSPSSSSLNPRKEEGEDPFNLGGFFPSRPGSPGLAVSSAWLEEEEGEVLPPPLMPAREEVEERRFGGGGARLPPKKSLSMSALDDYAKNVIAHEGQVGILSFGEFYLFQLAFCARKLMSMSLRIVPSFLSKLSISTPMLSKETIDEDEEYDVVRTPSTMSIDEPFDAESLLASHTDRRNSASFSPLQIETAIPTSYSLFSPTKEADDPLQLQHLSLGWADSLYSRLIAPVL